MIKITKLGLWYIDKEILNKIINNIKNKVNTLIIGEKGIGKTYLLKNLELMGYGIYINSPLKSMLLKIASKYNINAKTNYELKEKILSQDKVCVLLVDDYDKKTKYEREFILTLKRKGYVIIATAKRNLTEFIISFKLNEIPKKERSKFLEYFTDNKKLIKKISLITGNPEKMIDFSKANKVKINLKLPTKNQIIGLAFLALALKYIFYSLKEFYYGYLFATIGYLLIFAKRFSKY